MVIYRNGDNLWVGEPNVAIGDFPKTGSVINLPMLEKMIYETVINYDQFGAAQNGVVSLFGFGLSRRNWEINFLRFLPADKRHAIYDSWYQKSHPELILPRAQLPDMDKLSGYILQTMYPDPGPDHTVPAEIQFKTKRSQARVLHHAARACEGPCPNGRPDQPAATRGQS